MLPHGTTICDNKMVHDSHLDKNEKDYIDSLYSKIDFIFNTSKRDFSDAMVKGLKN